MYKRYTSTGNYSQISTLLVTYIDTHICINLLNVLNHFQISTHFEVCLDCCTPHTLFPSSEQYTCRLLCVRSNYNVLKLDMYMYITHVKDWLLVILSCSVTTGWSSCGLWLFRRCRLIAFVIHNYKNNYTIISFAVSPGSLTANYSANSLKPQFEITLWFHSHRTIDKGTPY